MSANMSATEEPTPPTTSITTSLASFADKHGLQFTHSLIPARDAIIVLGNQTRAQNFAVVLGVTSAAQGLMKWDRSKGKESPRIVKALLDAGCRYEPAGYFSQRMKTAVIEFDPNDPKQAEAVIKLTGVKKRSTAAPPNTAGLERWNAQRRAEAASVTIAGQ